MRQSVGLIAPLDPHPVLSVSAISFTRARRGAPTRPVTAPLSPLRPTPPAGPSLRHRSRRPALHWTFRQEIKRCMFRDRPKGAERHQSMALVVPLLTPETGLSWKRSSGYILGKRRVYRCRRNDSAMSRLSLFCGKQKPARRAARPVGSGHRGGDALSPKENLCRDGRFGDPKAQAAAGREWHAEPDGCGPDLGQDHASRCVAKRVVMPFRGCEVFGTIRTCYRCRSVGPEGLCVPC